MSAGNTSSKASQQSTSSQSAYTAYNAVDNLVAKPVLGSDGAAKWQNFSRQIQTTTANNSIAPTAPLKALDRAVGFTSWKEEKEYSNRVRKSEHGNSNKISDIPGVYTHFSGSKTPTSDEISSKERKRIERRIIGDNQEYFLPSSTFSGWKFDYVFTTKASHGTGYYFDGMDSIKKLKGQLKEDDIPPPLDDSHLNGVTKKRASSVDEGIPTQNQNLKTKKKKSNAPSVTIINNPNHPLEQVAAILAQRAASQMNPYPTALPNGWDVARTSDGTEYFYNRTTGERTWEKPTIVREGDHLPSNKSVHPPDSWNVATDPNTGKNYYFNPRTGETSWEKPNG